jgi:alanine-synthesizing transaminase
MAGWYQRRYGVHVDPDTECVATIGSKEGLSTLFLATLGAGDLVAVPDPCYPIHEMGVRFAGGDILRVPTGPALDPRAEVKRALDSAPRTPKMLVVNFPHNPTTAVAERPLFEWVVGECRRRGIWILSDLAYADLVFDGHKPTSILEIPGAKEIAVEFFTLSKSYSMPGWRVGFCVGNRTLVGALTKMKAYLDYGMFEPIQEAATAALSGPQDCVDLARETYRGRRDLLCAGLRSIGWDVTVPRASMFVWAQLPESLRGAGSLAVAERFLTEAQVAVSPGVGFGPGGEGHVRFALVEARERIEQAVARLAKVR